MHRHTLIVVSSVLASLGLSGCLFFGLATVGGSLTGLSSGVSITLQNNGKDDLTLTENGRFTFSRTLDSGDDYNVTVLTQPIGQSCSVLNGSGKIDSRGKDVDNVQVSCTNTGNLVGTISGLPASNFVTLVNNGANPLFVTANGNFAFPGILSNGTNYSVTVSTQPAGGVTCTVTGGVGQIQTNVPNTTITVTCS